MFGQTFLNDPARAELKRQWREHMIANHRVGISRAVTGVCTRASILDEIKRIKIPTLILMGEEDAAIPIEQAQRIHFQITDSKLMIVPRAGHTLSVEEPAAVASLLEEFISRNTITDGHG
jgi:pimeloyl-ACP methyl ester carboxylesterase